MNKFETMVINYFFQEHPDKPYSKLLDIIREESGTQWVKKTVKPRVHYIEWYARDILCEMERLRYQLEISFPEIKK